MPYSLRLRQQESSPGSGCKRRGGSGPGAGVLITQVVVLVMVGALLVVMGYPCPGMWWWTGRIVSGKQEQGGRGGRQVGN